MDYEYVKLLLERYWRCETSLEEEEELRRFFATTEEIPTEWLAYRDLFVYQACQQKVGLGKEFDKRILAQIEAPVVKARRITLLRRLTPLLKAAAIVVLVLALSNVIRYSFSEGDTYDYERNMYRDTYDDPEVAYKEVSSALRMLSEGINKTVSKEMKDSLCAGVDEGLKK